LFAAHLVAMPDGTVGVYRKLHIAPPEQPLYAAGDRIPLFDACGIRFGIQLCYDAHFPELSTRMALEGADVIFMPHASPRGNSQEKLTSWMRHLTARAFDNGLFVVACNQTGDNGHGLQFPGLALALDPIGNIMNEYAGPTETILIVDLMAAELEAVRSHRMRYFLPNRRPEIYKL
jgi:N-carbamoylputrescine amidase